MNYLTHREGIMAMEEKIEDIKKLEEDSEDAFNVLAESYMNDDDVLTYLKEISEYPLLSIEEEQALVSRIALGDKEAEELLVKSNLRLVVKLAKSYLNHGLSILDLIQEGNTGLLIAACRYELGYGTKFSSYAAFWIKEAMIKGIADKGRNIRIPNHQYELVVSFKKAYRKLEFTLKRNPTLEEIAHYMNLSLEEVKVICELQKDTISINELLGDDNDQERENFLASDIDRPEEIFEQKELSRDLETFLKTNLSLRELEVITLRFGLLGTEVLTLEEIASRYNMTREGVRKLIKRTLIKLKNIVNINDFVCYMDNPDKCLGSMKDFQEEYAVAKKERRLKKLKKKYTF